ncbi:hypothetical protein NDU88_007016 [Pleurodeles waltl]|uniref:Uncharacterized protein n=1 Tax=Pleurodeles waltl TaxID=8319 RepID=A0AAV7N0X6_PLEWA|nr:hypothetical protein NDU88_007016 [Pleurodeles waltl]
MSFILLPRPWENIGWCLRDPEDHPPEEGGKKKKPVLDGLHGWRLKDPEDHPPEEGEKNRKPFFRSSSGILVRSSVQDMKNKNIKYNMEVLETRIQVRTSDGRGGFPRPLCGSFRARIPGTSLGWVDFHYSRCWLPRAPVWSVPPLQQIPQHLPFALSSLQIPQHLPSALSSLQVLRHLSLAFSSRQVPQCLSLALSSHPPPVLPLTGKRRCHHVSSLAVHTSRYPWGLPV